MSIHADSNALKVAVHEFVKQYDHLLARLDEWTFPADVADDWVELREYENDQEEQDEWIAVAQIANHLTQEDFVAIGD
jgi:hypothetical protein